MMGVRALNATNLTGSARDNIQQLLATHPSIPLLESNVWRITESYSINFSKIKNIPSVIEWERVNKIDSVFLFKVLFVLVKDGIDFRTVTAQRIEKAVSLFITYCAEKGVTNFGKGDLVEFFTYFLTHQFDGDRIVKLVSIKHPVGWMGMFSFSHWGRFLAASGFVLSIEKVSAEDEKEAVKKALSITTDGEVTFNDWLEGGTLNNLTLDFGKYYIDYNYEYFSEYYPLATSFARVLKERDEIINQLGLSSFNYRVFPYILSGCNISYPEIRNEFKIGAKAYEKIKTEVSKRLTKYFDEESRKIFLLGQLGFDKICCALDVDEDSNESESLRFVLVNNIYFSRPLETLCEQTGFNSTQVNCALEKVTEDYYKPPSIPSYENLLALNLKVGKESDLKIPTNLIRSIRDAGITLFCAYNGWRASEFSFPYSAVKEERNKDFADLQTYPNRFFVKYKVFKTHGNIDVDREISLTSFLLIKQLKPLLTNGNQDDKSAFYGNEPGTSKKNLDTFKHSLTDSLARNWERFIDNYVPFNQIRKGLEGYDPLTIEAERVLSNQITKYRFFQRPLKYRTRFSSDSWIVHYYAYLNSGRQPDAAPQISPEHLDLLDTTIPEDVKQLIKSDIGLKQGKANRYLTDGVMSMVTEDLHYPNPHSFRHMWAESVYRRFDGDIGWMIRSQFKHISQGMWLAYVNDKSNRREHDSVKVAVKNSLLKGWLENEGMEYSGRFHKFLRRVMRKIRLTSDKSSMDKVAEFIAGEVISIKANPWGFCLLRKRAEHSARCNDGHGPKPIMATPSLCLNCVNNLIKKSNLDFIVFNAMSHANILSSQSASFIPRSLLKQSYDVVWGSIKAIQEIDQRHPMIEHLTSSLGSYRTAVEESFYA